MPITLGGGNVPGGAVPGGAVPGGRFIRETMVLFVSTGIGAGWIVSDS